MIVLRQLCRQQAGTELQPAGLSLCESEVVRTMQLIPYLLSSMGQSVRMLRNERLPDAFPAGV